MMTASLICEPNEDGFFSAVFYAYDKKIDVDMVVTSPTFQLRLISQPIAVATDLTHSERVKKSIISKFGYQTYNEIHTALANGSPYGATIVYKYVRLLFDRGKAVTEMVNLPEVGAFRDKLQEVTYEKHRMVGFVRFSETTSGIYYAAYSPDNNITEFIMPHFTSRFFNMSFILHDKLRNIVGVHQSGGASFVEKLDRGVAVEFTEAERAYRRLFKTYYDSVNIESRKNKKLQNGWLPVRYRKNMNEFD